MGGRRSVAPRHRSRGTTSVARRTLRQSGDGGTESHRLTTVGVESMSLRKLGRGGTSGRGRSQWSGVGPELKRALRACLELSISEKLSQGTLQDIEPLEVEALCYKLKRDWEEEVLLTRIGHYLRQDEIKWSPVETDCAMRLLEEAAMAAASSKMRPTGSGGNEEDELLVSKKELIEVFASEELQNCFKMRRTTFRQEAEKKQKQEEEQRLIEEAIASMEVSREDMVDHIGHVVARDDAFMTMPLTLIYIVLWIVIVFEHLAIWERQTIENGLQTWMDGPNPNLTSTWSVRDMDTLWAWTFNVALPQFMLEEKAKTVGTTSYVEYLMANRNTLVGDVRFERKMFNGSSSHVWLLHTANATAFLQQNPGQFLNATQSAATYLQTAGWADPFIKEFYVQVLSYNQFMKAYIMTQNHLTFTEYGFIVKLIGADAVLIRPYRDWWAYVVDGLFLVLVLYIATMEAKSMLSSLRLSFQEFKDYWELWNVVDWCNIIMSLLVCSLWLGIVESMTDSTLRGVLDSDLNLKLDTMSLSEATLEAMWQRVKFLRNLLHSMHAVMGINTVVIVLKFFKAFQSNPRLKVVTDTFVQAAVDLVHFFVIFTTLFFPFVLIGHILFGNDIPELGGLFLSINTGFNIILGNFDWYALLRDASPSPFSEATDRLPSGMSTLILFLWFFLFQFVLTITVLNMLLGIILEHYTRITGDLSTNLDAPPIWVQVQRYLTFKRDTRGFITLEKIHMGLNNDDDPAHPNHDVTVESLKEAFEGMQDKQCDYLMGVLQRGCYYRMKQLEKEDEVANLLPEILDKSSSTATLLETFSKNLTVKYPRLEKKLDAAFRALSDFRRDEEQINKLLTELENQLDYAEAEAVAAGATRATPLMHRVVGQATAAAAQGEHPHGVRKVVSGDTQPGKDHHHRSSRKEKKSTNTVGDAPKTARPGKDKRRDVSQPTTEPEKERHKDRRRDRDG